MDPPEAGSKNIKNVTYWLVILNYLTWAYLCVSGCYRHSLGTRNFPGLTRNFPGLGSHDGATAAASTSVCYISQVLLTQVLLYNYFNIIFKLAN